MSQLEQEILEQGAALARRAQSGNLATSAVAELLRRLDVYYVLIAARGSSDNVARFAQYALGAQARISVALATPSLYTDPAYAPALSGAAVLGISQSGQSPDIVGVLTAARLQGRPTIALTNDERSPLALAADQVIPLETGPEQSVAATKTYLSSLYAIEQIIQHLRPDDARGRWLDRLPELVSRVASEQLRRREDFEVLDSVNMLTVVGRGLDFSAAHETALKIRELSGTPAEPFSPADLLHGPIAALRDGGGLWVVNTHRELDPGVVELLDRIQDRDLRKVLVSRDLPTAAVDALHIPVPDDIPDWVASILAVLPGQVAALALASRRGGDVDAPHGLSKVTLTR